MSSKEDHIFFRWRSLTVQKRKNIINLCNHQTDLGIQAEWHFSVTSNGKGPYDGVGGTMKCLAARASLQRPYEEQIMTLLKLFESGSRKSVRVLQYRSV